MMNTMPRDKRRSQRCMVHLEFLDDRIVPAVVHPSMVAAADVATALASADSRQSEGNTAGESELQIRRATHLAKIAERHEAAIERRDARLARRVARKDARVVVSGRLD